MRSHNAPEFLPLIKLDTFFLNPLAEILVLFLLNHLLNIDLTTDQNSTPTTPNRVDYPMIVNDTHFSSPRQDLRFLYIAFQKRISKTQIYDERRRKEFHRLDTTNLEVKFEITAKFHNLCPRPFPSHSTVNFKFLPYTFIALISIFWLVIFLLSVFSTVLHLLKHKHIFKIAADF